MKFKCASSDLQSCISVVEKAISQRTSLQVLENLYIEVKNNKLTMRGNDLEIGIQNVIPVSDVQTEGSILVKSKTLSSITSKLSNQSLDVEVGENNKMVIRAGKVAFDILCLSVDEYPAFPSIETGVGFKLKVSELKELIKHTIFAVSFDETKQFLNGVLVKHDNGLLNFVSTDGYRLSIKNKSMENLERDFSAIVPYKAMNEIGKIIQQMDASQEVSLNVSDSQVAFSVGDLFLISRVTKGQFPDYNQVLPKETTSEFNIPRRFLIDASERASIIATASNNVVRLVFNDGSLSINANAASLGDFKEDIDITRVRGEGEIKVAFNVRLILDVIKTVDGDDLVIKLNNGLSPCVIKAVNDETYNYVVMPIRTNEYQEKKEVVGTEPAVSA